MFPDEKAKLKAGRISYEEKELILQRLGELAQEKYDEFLMQGASAKGYNLEILKGSLKFDTDVFSFDNVYYLEGSDDNITRFANYFEYGTGLYNTKRAGKYRAGYIKPVDAEYMTFLSNKTGKFVKAKKTKGVEPIFAMEKAKKYVEFNRDVIQRNIRLELQNE